MKSVRPAAVLLLAASAASAQITIVPHSVVVKGGDPAASGRPAPDVFSLFYGNPSVNTEGRIAFAAQLTPAAGGATTTSVWTTVGGPLTIVALQGTAIAPGSSDPNRLWGQLASAKTYVADNGRITAVAQGSPVFPLGSASSVQYGLLARNPAGVWSILAYNTQPMPGYPGRTINTSFDYAASRSDNGWTAIPARDVSHDQYYLKEDAAGLSVADMVPTQLLGGVMTLSALNPGGDYCYVGHYTDGVSITGFLRGQVGATTPWLALGGTIIQLLNQPGEWSIFPERYEQPRLNASGEYTVTCGLRPSTHSGTPMGAALRVSAAGAVLLAMEGEPVPGSDGLVWGSLLDGVPVISDTGESAWLLQVTGPGVTAANNRVLALFGPGDSPTCKIVARGGDTIPDMPGYTLRTAIYPAMTPSGHLMFNCTLNGPEISQKATFGVDSAGRTRLVAAAKGTSVVLPGIGADPLVSLSSTELTGGNDGQSRQLTGDGRLASIIRTEHGRAVVFFKTPCPADIAVAGGLPGYDHQLDNNDFIVFINHFFSSDVRADYGSAGGLTGSDGQFDNNDFIAFINEFFAGCD